MIIDANIDPRTSVELSVFVDQLIEHCAKLAEHQARVYTGERNESAGCLAAAHSIRVFGKTDQN
jgi:hypothetical protein